MEATVDCRDVDARLDAYVDRELRPDESESLDEHLATCAACRQRLADRQSLSRLVRRAPYYSAPAGLRQRIAQSQSRAPAPWLSRRLAAAAAMLLAASLAGSALVVRWASPAVQPGDLLAQAIVDSHVRALMGEHLFDVRSTDQHTVKPWFLGKLDFSPPVDDLARLGFPLTGGRLDYVAGRPAAALVYTRGQHAINVFIWPEPSAAGRASDTRAIRGFHLRHWLRGGMSFWAVSDLNDLELDQFVRGLQP
jgi:anti-sigma factor (TIGR02949 family)